jgi:hypothetical protein
MRTGLGHPAGIATDAAAVPGPYSIGIPSTLGALDDSYSSRRSR